MAISHLKNGAGLVVVVAWVVVVVAFWRRILIWLTFLLPFLLPNFKTPQLTLSNVKTIRTQIPQRNAKVFILFLYREIKLLKLKYLQSLQFPLLLHPRVRHVP